MPDDFRELRPNVTSLADLNGDGRKELVVGLFNLNGDNRWHTVALDATRGLATPLADLPDRYFWGCYDLDGDGRPEIITSTEKARRFTPVTTLQAVDGRTFRDLAVLEHASLFLTSGRLPANTAFNASRSTPLPLRQPDGAVGLLARQGERGGFDRVWRLREGRSALEPSPLSSVSLAALLSSGAEQVDDPNRTIRPLPDDAGYAAFGPLVGLANGRRELVLSRSDGTVLGGEPDWTRPGHFQRSWTIPGKIPALWLGSQGERLVCALDGETIRLAQPTEGAKTAVPDITIRPPYPVYANMTTRSAPTLLPFGTDSMRLFVGLQTGVHTMASALYDAGGNLLWLAEKEGPYPRTAAAADLTGRGEMTLIVDNHGKHLFYDQKGGSRLIAHGWHNTVPGRGDGAKYAVPIVGPFGPRGETRLVMSPGLQSLEALDAAGARLAKRDFASAYEFEWCGSAVAQIRGKGRWDLGMANQEGIFHCADLETCQTRWTFNLGTKASQPFNIVSGDLDGDGRDNFLVGLPNGELLALDEKGGRGVLLWKVIFEAGVKEAIIADVDGDGRAEIIVETDDGYIRVLKERR
jgi:hypothetical protein